MKHIIFTPIPPDTAPRLRESLKSAMRTYDVKLRLETLGWNDQAPITAYPPAQMDEYYRVGVNKLLDEMRHWCSVKVISDTI